MSMQFQKPVPQPQHRRGPGVIESLQLQFSSWDVSSSPLSVLKATFSGLRAFMDVTCWPLPILSLCPSGPSRLLSV